MKFILKSSTILLILFWVILFAVYELLGFNYILIIAVSLLFLSVFIRKDIKHYYEVTSINKLKEKLTNINEITQALRSAVNLKDVLKLILRNLTKELGFDRAFIFLNEKYELKGTIGIGIPLEIITMFNFRMNDRNNVIVRSATENRYFIIKNAKYDKRCNKEFVEMLDLDEFAAIPLEAKGKVVGVLIVDKQNITYDDVEILSIFSNQAAIAIENAKLYEKFEMLSITDGLTELFNHRYFHEQLIKEFDVAKESGTKLAIIMIDVDSFKNYNDTFGHQKGDALLKNLSNLIKRNIRKYDIAARYGGDEFSIVLPDVDKGNAIKFAERLRRNFANQGFSADNFKITISIGIASYPKDADTPAGLIAAADKFLYDAKKKGKNRIVANV